MKMFSIQILGHPANEGKFYASNIWTNEGVYCLCFSFKALEE